MLPLIPLALSFLPDAARLIGGLIAGPRGADVAGSISDVIETVTGTADPYEAQAILDSNPEMAGELRVKLAGVLADQTVALAQAENEARRIAAADTADARHMALSNAQAGVGNRMRDLVAIGTILIFLIAGAGSVLALLYDASSIVVAAVNIVVGASISGYQTTISYFLGSSAGSAAKAMELAKDGRNRP